MASGTTVRQVDSIFDDSREEEDIEEKIETVTKTTKAQDLKKQLDDIEPEPVAAADPGAKGDDDNTENEQHLQNGSREEFHNDEDYDSSSSMPSPKLPAAPIVSY